MSVLICCSYTEAATIAKATSDHLWHGAALYGFGVCLVLLSYHELPFSIPSIAQIAPVEKSLVKPEMDSTRRNSDVSLVDYLPELHSNVINLYHRSSGFPADTVPPFCLAESALRLGKLLVSVHLAGGWNKQALRNIVLGTPISISASKRARYPPRAEIAAWGMRAYAPHLDNLGVADKCHIYGGLANILGSVGFQRRKAFFLKEIVTTLIPALIHARVTGAAEKGIHPAAGLAIGHQHNAASQKLLNHDTLQLESLIEELCHIYGLPKQGNYAALEASILGGFGWPALKISVLRECIAVLEAVPDFKGVLRHSTKMLESVSNQLNADDQTKLATNLPRIMAAAKKIGTQDVEIDYWDRYLLRSITLDQ